MRKLIKPFFCFLFSIFFILESKAQREIDFRQYVQVLYRKNPVKGKFDTAWLWRKDKFEPFQKYSNFDVDGEVKIIFLKDSLVKNPEIEGTFSLEAEISGKDGTRRIEVSPYSEIGVQRTPLGIESASPSEVSKRFLNMLNEILSLITKKEEIFETAYASSFPPYILSDIQKAVQHLQTISDSILKEEDASTIKSDLNFVEIYDIPKLSNSQIDFITIDTLYSLIAPKIVRRNLINGLNKLIIELNVYKTQVDKEEQEKNERDHMNDYKNLLSKVELVLEYMNSFDKAGEEANKAFLSLINNDVIGYSSNKKELSNSLDDIRAIVAGRKDKNLDIRVAYNACIDALKKLIPKRQSKLENEIIRIGYNGNKNEYLEKNAKKFDYSYYDYYDDDTLPLKPSFDTTSYYEKLYSKNRYQILYDNLNSYYDGLSISLSLEATNIIFKKLVFATIDLGKSGSKVGESLHLYLVWKNQSSKNKTDSSFQPPRLELGRYNLRETGLKLEVADNFALIERLKETALSSVPNNTVSPSNFKGAGGAVLMATYYGEDKGLNENFRKKNQILNILQPSIGLNVSYLDFDTRKDVEIGTGIQLGLFHNKIFFGYGVNLHMIRKTDSAPTYLYVGFSFAKLADMFKDAKKVESIPY